MDDQTVSRFDVCYKTLLPIGERWTDSDPSLRRFLDCVRADPANHEERLQAVIQASATLRRHGPESPSTAAACAAASACLKAYVGVPEAVWRDACAWAALAHTLVEGLAPLQ